MNDRRRRRIRAIAEVPQAAGPIRIGTPPEGFAYLLAAAWAAYRWLAARQHEVNAASRGLPDAPLPPPHETRP